MFKNLYYHHHITLVFQESMMGSFFLISEKISAPTNLQSNKKQMTGNAGVGEQNCSRGLFTTNR